MTGVVSRRVAEVAATADAQSPVLTHAFSIAATLGIAIDHGIVGGRVDRPCLTGKLLTGGGDWQAIGGDRLTEVDARYSLSATDGKVIGVTNTGMRAAAPAAAKAILAGRTVSTESYDIPTSPTWPSQAALRTTGCGDDLGRSASGVRTQFSSISMRSDNPAAILRKDQNMTELSPNGVVAYDIVDRIAWVRFNRPDKRNCMSPTLNQDMLVVLDALEYRDDVGLLVLSGEGSAWSAGMDLKEYFRETEAKGIAATRQAQREAYGWWRRLRWYQKPTIAMVNGWCFGGGYGPLFACDLAFAADEAQFGLSEINWGILPGGGATKVAQELLPFRKAMYHAMMGENVDGRTAADWGLVNEALPLAGLKARVTEVAGVLLKKNPIALKATKDAMRRVGPMSYDDAEDYLIRAQEAANSYDNEGRKEGIKQFIDDKTFKPGLGTYDLDKQQA